MLLGQGIQEFIKYMKLIDRSEQTITGYEKELIYFDSFLSVKHNCPVYIEDVTLEDIEDYLLDQKKRGIASASRSRSVYILRSFYNYCVKKDITAKNIASLIEPVKVKQKERDYLTEEEFNKLAAAIKQPVIRTAVETMFYTGGRMSEIIHLKLDDVNLEEKVIHITKGKGGKARDIPINDKLCDILKNYIENIRDAKSSRFFALKSTGKVSSSYVNRLIKEAAYEVGLKKDVSAHILRHSFGTNLLEKGASVVSIQKLLGHANLAVTTRYLHQDMNKLSDTVNLL
ncbi:MAG TPA: tyrosine-type recombinase/integrase [Tepidanaerobacter syntrophicus]|uniref:tyrosine-type recombinase/integrase n=1 Tax=Tepidanaerobacter syntrophicus TaxID=224999 RepID=UPI001752947C|nr:tyrosine-type recombinase/integrase [Tepidanaerobacter syntrophicus]HHV82745.1 tyrosine-type recombinase/integrase [Tepidanaerobacter syntrophicus]